ncbi:hypothetical protein CPB83DRAFT_70692 [Crepidotus variabilis]|uniref:Uncharacterized protein n=1 Tax=Crepidotus variabilis TaxID=179855 RepID=A0A9P6E5J5_9AGAR|nr:hypothetical protein CPB83DRAFT_70692 [Crepidotus variabilis]
MIKVLTLQSKQPSRHIFSSLKPSYIMLFFKIFAPFFIVGLSSILVTANPLQMDKRDCCDPNSFFPCNGACQLTCIDPELGGVDQACSADCANDCCPEGVVCPG